MAGWIKLDRQITDHWLWGDSPFTKGQAWIDLLLKANHSDNKITIKGCIIELRAGQQARSELTLSKDWEWSRGKVRRFLKMLESDSMIVQHTNHLTSIITVSNYGAFQRDEKRPDTPSGTAPSTPLCTAGEQHTVHSKECKNVENGKNLDKPKPAAPEWMNDCLDAFWKTYPKKVDKKTSLERLTKMIKAKPDYEHFRMILAAITAKAVDTDKQFFPTLNRYLRDEKWTDEIIPRGESNGQSQPRKLSSAERSQRDQAAMLAIIEANENNTGPLAADDAVISTQMGISGGSDNRLGGANTEFLALGEQGGMFT